ncbi:SusC/RagA family TonB-linked outer membrane protein [Flavobacterium beibuense]|uniref:TonB-linked outer membrane protein, SusC/RagA family n=1 Tax=Flavobacterium beibuense TaxID=657326 RepID=A0A444W5X6_9FLAO|nr:SusC/RagA family TonB-linked outer membrane protein [Flavobacterium beibuense]RYJ41270.1 TonB-linked outer membrane protein, SusC/RagA family [Flavobacterium beibuense]
MRTMYKKLLLLLLLLPLNMLAQSTLTGTVSDGATGEPLPGVNVIVEGTTNGTATDFDGNFTLPNINNGQRIVFSFIGYADQVIEYNGQSSLTISLQEDTTQLEEVVVVGYGTVKKKDATGSVEVITPKTFNKGFNATAENQINGRVAGVTIATNGAPGSGSDIRIRGGASLGANNSPLIVIDGLPISNDNVGGSTSILASINPNDIESYSILKDASATAIYGSRASNGVIIITTKKGNKGDLKVSFNALTTYNTLAKKVNMLSSSDYRNLVNEFGTPTQVALLGDANTDWQDEIFENTMSVNSNLTLTGNLFKTLPVRLSVGYTDVPGLLKTGEFKRTTTSLALNPSFFDDHLKINLNANVTWQDNRFADEGAIGNALRFDPTQPVYDADSYYGGYFEWLEADGDRVVTGSQMNPVSLLEQRRNVTDNRRIYGNVQFDYKFHFFEDLRAVLNLGLDKQEGSGTNTLSNMSPAGYSTGSYSNGNFVNYGSLTTFTDSRQNKLLDAYLVYAKEIGKVNLDLTGGYSYQLFEAEQFNSGNIYDPNSIADVNTNPDINLQSYFARMNIDFSKKYLLTLNYRRDGTSRFSPENRWGNFYSGAFAWRISEEAFLKDSKTISDLKLRVGLGVTGQQDIAAAYEYIPRYTTSTSTQGQYQFGNIFVPYGRPQGYNTGLKWEETTDKTIGLDYGFFNNRLTGSLNFFEKKSEDLLASVPYPDGANLTNQGFRNFGSFTTRGFEFMIDYNIVQSQDFYCNVNFNMFYNDREINDLANGVDIPTGDIQGGGGNTIQVHSVDYSPFSFYVYEQVYDVNGKPVEGVYVDRNKDGIINENDRYRYKKPYADFTFGFQNNMAYKNFDFSMAWRASVGNYMYNNVASNAGVLQAGIRYNDVISNIHSDFYNTGFLEEGNNRFFSDYYIQDASWIKLDNITLGYTIMDPLGYQNSKLRVNVGVQNVLTITDYDGVDPEIFSGIDNTIYPRARMFMFGVNLDF